MAVLEIHPTNVSISGPTCLGCKRHKKDAMITLTLKNNGVETYLDVFISKDQVIDIIKGLSSAYEDITVLVDKIQDPYNKDL